MHLWGKSTPPWKLTKMCISICDKKDSVHQIGDRRSPYCGCTSTLRTLYNNAGREISRLLFNIAKTTQHQMVVINVYKTCIYLFRKYLFNFMRITCHSLENSKQKGSVLEYGCINRWTIQWYGVYVQCSVGTIFVAIIISAFWKRSRNNVYHCQLWKGSS